MIGLKGDSAIAAFQSFRASFKIETKGSITDELLL
jgi:hypothetical protein